MLVWSVVGIGVVGYFVGLLGYEHWKTRDDPPRRPHGYEALEVGS